MQKIYHITSRSEAGTAARTGRYRPPGFDQEGFIHCSYRDQVVEVANRIFRGVSDLVLLEIDCSGVPHRIVDENLEGGIRKYPHIYGALPWRAVTAVIEFTELRQGGFELPCSMDP